MYTQNTCEDEKLLLRPLVEKIVSWMRADVLPLWTEEGVDRQLATSYAALEGDFECDPKVHPDRHGGWSSTSQALMIYVFSQAQHLGWLKSDESALVNNMIEFSGRHGVLPCRSDGFVHCLNTDLSILDGRRLLSDHACFMMASTASFVSYEVGNDLRRAYNIMHWLDIKMSHSDGGWSYQYGDPKPASSDSYLRCLQSFLYLFEVTRKPCWLERSGVIYDLFVERFFDPEGRTVHKYMIDLVEGVDQSSELVPASQMFLWVWLLRRYQQMMGGMAGDLLSDITAQLYEHAKTILSTADERDNTLRSAYILASSTQAQMAYPGADIDLVHAIEGLLECHAHHKLPGWCPDKSSTSKFTTTAFSYLFEATREAYLYMHPEERELPLREVGGL